MLKNLVLSYTVVWNLSDRKRFYSLFLRVRINKTLKAVFFEIMAFVTT